LGGLHLGYLVEDRQKRDAKPSNQLKGKRKRTDSYSGNKLREFCKLQARLLSQCLTNHLGGKKFLKATKSRKSDGGGEGERSLVGKNRTQK